MKFFSPEVALYIYKSTICPCMEYCCHTWAGAPNYNLELLDKLKNEYVGLLVLHLLLLLNNWLIVKMWPAYIFYRYYWGGCSSELAQLVPLPFSRGRSTYYSDRLHDFLVTIPRCYKNVYVSSFFSLHNLALEFSAYRMLSFDL